MPDIPWPKLLAGLLAVLAAGLTLGVVIDDDHDPKTGHRHRTITIELGKAHSADPAVKPTGDPAVKTIGDPDQPVTKPVIVDANQQLEPGQQQKSANPDTAAVGADLHEDMRDETPPGVTAQQLEQGKQNTQDIADDVLTSPKPPAGAQAYSCPSAPVVNQSALNGPRVGTALHFTVSRPGSLFVIRSLFNTPSFGASSNKIIELTGQCRTLVPDSRKAWAQGAANSAYSSIEIVTNDLTRQQWLAAPIIKRGILAAIVRDQNRHFGAPLRHVDPGGCTWTPGIVDHDDLECGNTHWDVGQNFPWDVFVRQVRQGVRRPITDRDRADCKRVFAIRKRRAAGAPRTAASTRSRERRLKRVKAHGLRCVDGKVSRR